MVSREMTCARIVVIAVAHGVAICCLAGATGAISGGHLNPAVTLAFVVAGKETLIRAALYVGAQVSNVTSSHILLFSSSRLEPGLYTCHARMGLELIAFS